MVYNTCNCLNRLVYSFKVYLKIGEILSEFIQNNEDGDLVSSKYIQKLDGTCYS